MKFTKKHWAMLIAGIVLLFIVYWLFFRKKKAESSYDPNLLIYGNGESAYAMGGPVTRASLMNTSARIKPWGGKVSAGTRLCFDTTLDTYVPCDSSPARTIGKTPPTKSGGAAGPLQVGYTCNYTNPNTGQVTSYNGPCTSVDANNGWITVFE